MPPTKLPSCMFVLKVSHAGTADVSILLISLPPALHFGILFRENYEALVLVRGCFFLLLAKITFKGIYYDVIKLKEKYDSCYKKIEI